MSPGSAGEAGRPDGATLRLHHGPRPAPHSGLVCSQQVGHIHITNMDRECFRVTLETGKVNHPHLCISPYAAIRGRMHKNKIKNVALSNVLLIRYLTMISLIQGSLCQQRRFLVLRNGLGLLRAGVKIWPKNRHFLYKKISGKLRNLEIYIPTGPIRPTFISSNCKIFTSDLRLGRRLTWSSWTRTPLKLTK